MLDSQGSILRRSGPFSPLIIILYIYIIDIYIKNIYFKKNVPLFPAPLKRLKNIYIHLFLPFEGNRWRGVSDGDFGFSPFLSSMPPLTHTPSLLFFAFLNIYF